MTSCILVEIYSVLISTILNEVLFRMMTASIDPSWESQIWFEYADLGQMAGCWTLNYVSWSGFEFSSLVHEIRQQLTLKVWENFTALFAYKVDYISVILLTLFSLPVWLCVQLLYMSEDGKCYNIFHNHFSLDPFEKLISVSRAP